MHFFHSTPFIQVLQPSVATIGNFDGMHLGHQSLLQALIQHAKQKQLKSTVILFEPQPLEFLRANDPPARLQTLGDKLSFLKQFGVDQVVVLRFDQKFSGLSAQDFIQHYLIDQLMVDTLLIGEGFRFGHKRLGSVDLLKTYEQQGLLNVLSLPLALKNNAQISSTEIRRQLYIGDFSRVQQLLGRPFAMSGRVMHGAKIGRLINFPTLNIALRRKVSPLQGVYAVQVKTESNGIFSGIANIGIRPTVTKSSAQLLEVFLFTKEHVVLYAHRIQVEFMLKVRDEQKFDALEALQAQIEKDVGLVQKYFSSRKK